MKKKIDVQNPRETGRLFSLSYLEELKIRGQG
jgi:hypothetical protein